VPRKRERVGLHRIALATVALGAAMRLAAQPVGGEFRVNASTTGNQLFPDVAISGGRFMVVWQSNQSGFSDIFGRRFDASGSPLTSEFRVNTYTSGEQGDSSVAASLLGDFVVVWRSSAQYGHLNIFGRRFAATGAPLGGEFRVNSETTLSAYDARVASDPVGNFVVVWTADDGDFVGVVGRRFSASGAPRGLAFRVNDATTGAQRKPQIAADTSGGFIAVWHADSDVFARRYDAAGVPFGTDFRVNAQTSGSQGDPSVGVDASGAFVVAWTDIYPNSLVRITGRRYSPSGAPLGSDFTVSTSTSGSRGGAHVGAFPGGGFLVAWVDDYPIDVHARRFTLSGAPIGPELRINSFTSGAQGPLAVAVQPSTFVVAWQSEAQDGAGYGIYAQVFSHARKAGDVNGDGFADVLDVFYLINFLFAGGAAPI
jgi:hypothetical protein